jgi:hypothetical protein
MTVAKQVLREPMRFAYSAVPSVRCIHETVEVAAFRRRDRPRAGRSTRVAARPQKPAG